MTGLPLRPGIITPRAESHPSAPLFDGISFYRLLSLSYHNCSVKYHLQHHLKPHRALTNSPPSGPAIL